MRVRILKTDERLGIKVGEIYSATAYRYDHSKITLEWREWDRYDPQCNQYKTDVAFWMADRWQVINGKGEFVPKNKEINK